MTNQKSETDKSNMPIEVKTENGLSVLYCGKYLYSKYNPKKNILKTIDSLYLKEGTLVLAFSPCLCFGLKELLKKLPENCYVVGIEYDAKLFELAKKYTNNLKGEENLHKNFMLVSKKYFSHLPFLLTQKTASNELDIKFPKPGTFKRIIKIDFSAGTQFFYSEYEQLFRSLEDSLSRFWKNRITLVKFGRKYSRNLFRNIARLPKSFPLHFLEKKIDKPILVLGAGESLEKIVPQILQMREYFFIIAVDVSYRFLLSFKIKADIVVCEESQLEIANAFISFTKKSLLVTGITSFPDIYNF
ncbi:MAG: motility associated factor glycosyltransferase family protein, partial [Treponema sp.]|nr:motility associated factor glycosyltransferase family protein [Treponema sp.]